MMSASDRRSPWTGGLFLSRLSNIGCSACSLIMSPRVIHERRSARREHGSMRVPGSRSLPTPTTARANSGNSGKVASHGTTRPIKASIGHPAHPIASGSGRTPMRLISGAGVSRVSSLPPRSRPVTSCSSTIRHHGVSAVRRANCVGWEPGKTSAGTAAGLSLWWQFLRQKHDYTIRTPYVTGLSSV